LPGRGFLQDPVGQNFPSDGVCAPCLLAQVAALPSQKTFQFAKFKYRLKIEAYHQRLSRLVPEAKYCRDVDVFWQLDNDTIVELSRAVAPQNFFDMSGYTSIFFGGIVTISLLPSSTKTMANGPWLACSPP
jgi:hypothetical protein